MRFDAPLPEPFVPPSLGTKEGWASFVETDDPEPPDRLSEAEYVAMSETSRFSYDRARNLYHSSFGPLKTTETERVKDTLYRLAVSNQTPYPGARPGAVIDGLANIGKTTVLKSFGREYERSLRDQHSDYMERRSVDEWIPVVYHSLKSQVTVKSLVYGLADFYGLPVSPNLPTHRLISMVTNCANLCHTKVFLIDDIHYLDMRNLGAVEVNNCMKSLANDTSATFVYAGIGCLKTGLLTEGKGKADIRFGQTRGRFMYLPVDSFAGSKTGVREWMRLVKSFEDELVLLRGYSGMCVEHSEYLFNRTNGFIGSLSSLLRTAALQAILSGEERVTKKILDSIPLDHASETSYENLLRRTRASKRARDRS